MDRAGAELVGAATAGRVGPENEAAAPLVSAVIVATGTLDHQLERA
jgi:hypothetical protein